MQNDAELYRDQDMGTRSRVEAQLRLKFVANNMQAFTEKPEYSGMISAQQKNEIIQLAQKALTWLIDNKEADVTQIDMQQKILDGYFNPLLKNLQIGPVNQYPNMNQQHDADQQAP